MKNRIIKFKWTLIAITTLIGISIILVSIFYSGMYCHILKNGSLGDCPAKNFIYNGKPFFDWRGITTNWIQSNSTELWSSLGLIWFGVGVSYLFLNLFVRKIDEKINEKFSKELILVLIISVIIIAYLDMIFKLHFIHKDYGVNENNIIGFSGIAYGLFTYSFIYTCIILLFDSLTKIEEKLRVFTFGISVSLLSSVIYAIISNLWNCATINSSIHIMGSLIGTSIAVLSSFKCLNL